MAQVLTDTIWTNDRGWVLSDLGPAVPGDFDSGPWVRQDGRWVRTLACTDAQFRAFRRRMDGRQRRFLRAQRTAGRGKVPIPDDLRWVVWERDNFTCRHCGARRSLSVDHIVPESRGGPMALDNLQTLCRSCNSRKGAR